MADLKNIRVAVNGYGVIGKRVATAEWADMLRVQGDELFYAYMVDNQAIVIPETIDAIRALTRTVEDSNESIARTNAALGINAALV